MLTRPSFLLPICPAPAAGAPSSGRAWMTSSAPCRSTTSWCCTPASCPRTQTPSWTASTRSAPSSTGAHGGASACLLLQCDGAGCGHSACWLGGRPQAMPGHAAWLHPPCMIHASPANRRPCPPSLPHPLLPCPLPPRRLYRDSTQYKDGKHVRDLSKLNRDMRQVGGAEHGRPPFIACFDCSVCPPRVSHALHAPNCRRCCLSLLTQTPTRCSLKTPSRCGWASMVLCCNCKRLRTVLRIAPCGMVGIRKTADTPLRGSLCTPL